MGLEADCTLRVGRDKVAGRAHLDSVELIFRGAPRLVLALATVKSAEVGKGGELHLTHAGGLAVLGFADRATAEKWMLKIRYPKSLIDKLGVKTGSRVAVLGVDDGDFEQDLRERLGAVPATGPSSGLDLIFYAADSLPELAKLKALAKKLQPTGAIWVVSLKGKAAKIKDLDVMHAARTAGLVDNKVCSFSATHTALKLVIPKAARGTAG
jgi:hypothetical protein